MPKVLCIIGMATAVLIAALFLLDLALPSIMFRRASVVMDVAMIVSSALLGAMSYLTFREQK